MAYIESFNGRMREEIQNERIDFCQARELIDAPITICNAAFFARIQDAGGLYRYTHRA